MVKYEKFTLNCDSCDWSKTLKAEDIGELHFWHNRLCPKCREAFILDDDDIVKMELFNSMIAGLRKIGEELGLDIDKVPPEQLTTLSFSSATDKFTLHGKKVI